MGTASLTVRATLTKYWGYPGANPGGVAILLVGFMLQ